METTVKSKKVQKVLDHINRGIEDAGCFTSTDFKTYCGEFRTMINEQIKLVGGTDYKQNNGHYFLSGFFTVGEQVYYISIGDVRWNNNNQFLIRTAESYKDFTGGRNNYLQIEDDLFVGKLPR